MDDDDAAELQRVGDFLDALITETKRTTAAVERIWWLLFGAIIGLIVWLVAH